MNRLPACRALAAASLAAALLALPSPAANTLGPALQPPDPRNLAIDELIAMNNQLAIDNQRLAAENARLNLDINRLQTEVGELRQFIQDHDQNADNFEKYAFFREQVEREARARAAAEARQRREQERQRALDERLNRNRPAAEEGDDAVLANRVEMLRRAGYSRIGDRVFVGEMGYSYRSEEREVIRYSPFIEHWYTDRTEVIDYRELSVSGSVIHAGSEERNISIALAFYDANGAQLGSTNVQVQAARPGVPYPFTATVRPPTRPSSATRVGCSTTIPPRRRQCRKMNCRPHRRLPPDHPRAERSG
jgi:hypothetical protein